MKIRLPAECKNKRTSNNKKNLSSIYLKKKDLRKKSIVGDGNCQPRSALEASNHGGLIGVGLFADQSATDHRSY